MRSFVSGEDRAGFLFRRDERRCPSVVEAIIATPFSREECDPMMHQRMLLPIYNDHLMNKLNTGNIFERNPLTKSDIYLICVVVIR